MDNMMARFNDDITHSAPKKLLFNRLSASFSDNLVPSKCFSCLITTIEHLPYKNPYQQLPRSAAWARNRRIAA